MRQMTSVASGCAGLCVDGQASLDEQLHLRHRRTLFVTLLAPSLFLCWKRLSKLRGDFSRLEADWQAFAMRPVHTRVQRREESG